MSIATVLLSIGLAASPILAVPTPGFGTFVSQSSDGGLSICQKYGECEYRDVFGYAIPTLVTPRNDTSSIQALNGETMVTLGRESISQRTTSATGDPPLDVFGQLWDRIGEICIGK